MPPQTRLRASFHFHLRGLLISSDLLGSVHVAHIDGASVEIVLPARGHRASDETPLVVPDDLFPADPLPLVEGGAHVTTSASVVPRADRAQVQYLRVRVTFSGDCSAQDFGPGGRGSDSGLRELARAEAIARKAADRLMATARTAHYQYWLGLSGEALTGVGSGRLEDLDAGRTLPVSRGLEPDFVLQLVDPAQVITGPKFKDVLSAVEEAEEPSLAESLLADAVYYADAAEPQDPARALLTAAIACELKIKTVLRQAANSTERGLVEVLLSNPRDYSLAVSALLDQPLKLLVGASLREADKPLWKQIDLLFAQRNRFAHRGVLPTADQADEGIQASVQLFGWLHKLKGD